MATPRIKMVVAQTVIRGIKRFRIMGRWVLLILVLIRKAITTVKPVISSGAIKITLILFLQKILAQSFA